MTEAHVIPRSSSSHRRRRRARLVRRALAGLITVGSLAGVNSCDNVNPMTTNLVGTATVGLVTTFEDTTFIFGQLHTFAMPDSIVHLFPLTAGPGQVTRMFDQMILNQIRQRLLERGFTEVANPATTRADFIVLPGVTATNGYNAWVGYSWFTFWGFFPGWKFFSPGFTTAWGIVYPWFPIIGNSSYATGTLIVDLIPTSSVNPTNETIQSAWAGVASGAVTGFVSASRLTTAIDQMFALSPFLTPGPAVAGASRIH